MPRKRTYRKKKRVYRRKALRPTQLSRIRDPMPDTYVTSHKYSDFIKLTPAAAGSAASVVYRFNSMFDPYQPAGGHQPMGYDQMVVFYVNYYIISCTATVIGLSEPTAKGYVAVFISQSPTAMTSPTDIMEQPKTFFRPFGNYSSTKISTTYNARKYWGNKTPISDLTALNNSDPSKIAYLHIYFWMVDEISSPVEFNGTLMLTFKAQWSQRQQLPQS